jgi:hypothetical protein
MVEAFLTRSDDIPGAKRRAEGEAILCNKAMEDREEEREGKKKRGEKETDKKRTSQANIRASRISDKLEPAACATGGDRMLCDWKCKMRRKFKRCQLSRDRPGIENV